MIEQNKIGLTVDDLGAEWGQLLAQFMVIKVNMKKQIDSLVQENENLRQKLHQMQIALAEERDRSLSDGIEKAAPIEAA